MSRRKGSELSALEVIVKGRVQRVGYRRFILDLAQELGVVGFIENLRDGGVRIFCQAHPKVLSRFVKKARNPPKPARVKQFDVKEVRPRPRLRYFRVKYGPVQEELQEGFGAMQAIFMDYWKEFRSFSKRTDDNFNKILDRYGEISEKLTQILDTLMEESKKSKEMLERIKADSKETRQTLSESMSLLRQAVEKLSASR